MTKKELTALHHDKCSMQAVDANLGRGEEIRWVVSFSLTAGELIALKNMLALSSTPSQQDVSAFFTNAAARAEIEI